MSEGVVPHSFSEAAAALAGAAAQGRAVRIVGGGTKLGWGAPTPARALQLHLAHLSRVTLHEDATATIGAGTPLVRAQTIFARSGLMLAADPQLGLGRSAAATVGGVVATADSGPLSHRHGPLRDQIVGITAALSSGRIVRTGPRAPRAPGGLDPAPGGPQPTPDGPDPLPGGLDLARLFTGALGTLGVILAVDVRLRPLPRDTESALASTDDPERLQAAVELIAQEHPELEAFDVAWHGGRGGLLAQVATGGDLAQVIAGGGLARAAEDETGEAAPPGVRAQAVARTMAACGLADAGVRSDDAGLWARQRAGQRSAGHALLRVQHRVSELARVLRVADAARATLVGRAALGISYLTLDVPQIAAVRATLPEGATAVALDLPASARGAVDPWNVPEGPQLELMRELKAQFDPAGVCNPGVFVGGI